MVLNILGNLPNKWRLQIFYTGTGQSQVGIDINNGFKRLIQEGKIVLTLIPPTLLARKKKKVQLMTDRWMWENMLADKVFFFGGNSVICSNSPKTLDDYIDFDYIGAPWGNFKGEGGGNGVSLRSRHAMLAAIDYEHAKIQQNPDFDLKFGDEDIFFIKRLKEMQSKGLKSYKIATKNETFMFGATGNLGNEYALVASGTLPGMYYKQRETFLQYCPELKMLFPMLHDPSCFGASPDSEKCAASICALKPKSERKGGC